jgi:mono/diheme cytochrome c family protein
LARDLNYVPPEACMATRFGAAATVIGSALLVWTTVVAAGNVPPQSPTRAPVASDGAWLFKTYCAACHGESARGDGPLADSMRRRPANLTEILKREGGTFSKEKVFQIIDGRRPVRGHGGPDMPVWGDAFRRSREGGDEASVERSINAIVAYLESIQARSGN